MSFKFSVCLLIVSTAVKVIEEETSEQLSPAEECRNPLHHAIFVFLDICHDGFILETTQNFSVFVDVNRDTVKPPQINFWSSILWTHRSNRLVNNLHLCLIFFLIFFFAVNFTRHPLPLPRTWPPTQPWFFLFHRLPNIFWKRPPLAVSLWNILTPPHQPLLSQASSSGPRSLYQLFVRDLPPQSHKSTEDRCLLCLIKALPPGVIPQFEQEEKPSEGGECSGSILWRAHIIHSHLDFTKETQPASVLKPPSTPLQPPPTALLFCLCLSLFYSPFFPLLICFSFGVIVGECPGVPAG